MIILNIFWKDPHKVFKEITNKKNRKKNRKI